MQRLTGVSLPSSTPAEQAHERYPVYAKYRRACKGASIPCEDFANWLAFTLRWEQDKAFAEDPQFTPFQRWIKIRGNGGRKCPAGSFPENYLFWVNGGRW